MPFMARLRRLAYDTARGEPVSTAANSVIIAPVARRMKLSDHVVETISRLIVEGGLDPGAIIRTEDLARQLGVSRTPMREALQRLEAEGFVTVSPNGTAKVAMLEGEKAMEMMDLREVVDGLACRVLAERGCSEIVHDELAQLAASAEQAGLADDKHGFLRLDARFHSTILTATSHRPLQQFHSLVRITSQVVYLRLGWQKLRHQQSSREHAEILNAIKGHDPAQAERCARQHVRRAAQFWLKGRQVAVAAADE